MHVPHKFLRHLSALRVGVSGVSMFFIANSWAAAPTSGPTGLRTSINQVNIVKIQYGADERQFYLLKTPKDLDLKSVKVLVNVHGGAFVAGDAQADNNMQNLFLRKGFVVASIEYRLLGGCPNFRWGLREPHFLEASC